MQPRWLALFAASAVGAAACSGPETSVRSEGSDRTTSMPRRTTTSESMRSEGESTVAVVVPPDLEALGYVVTDSTEPTTSIAPTTSTVPVTATTAGSGGAPVTTIAGGSEGDPAGIYKGVLGSLDPDEPVATPVAAPPVAAPGTLPLTGLVGSVPNRPAAVVKIDNGRRARPQTGLNSADIVVEEEVEGGLTRFAAIFHSTDTIVGPVRSGRTTDIGVLVGLGSPLLMYSGANEVTDALLRQQAAVQNRSAARSSGYWRDNRRRAPSNLYTDTAPHWASASGPPPPAQFTYRDPAEPSPGSEVDGFTVAFRSNTAAWQWDGGEWLRSQGGKPHVVATGDRVSAANVVVAEVARVDTGMVDSSGASVPEFVFVGSGPVTVFTDGKRITGTWTRPTLASGVTLTTDGGTVIELTPGRTWIELIEAGAGILR